MLDYQKAIAAIDRQIDVALADRNGQVTRLRKEKTILVARAMKAAEQ